MSPVGLSIAPDVGKWRVHLWVLIQSKDELLPIILKSFSTYTFTPWIPAKAVEKHPSNDGYFFHIFSVAVVTANQWAKTTVKALIVRWIYIFGIASRIHSNKGKSFDNNNHSILMESLPVKDVYKTLHDLLKKTANGAKSKWTAYLSILYSHIMWHFIPQSDSSHSSLCFRTRLKHLLNQLGLFQYHPGESMSKNPGLKTNINWYRLQLSKCDMGFSGEDKPVLSYLANPCAVHCI